MSPPAAALPCAATAGPMAARPRPAAPAPAPAPRPLAPRARGGAARRARARAPPPRSALRPGETADEALARRLRETDRVEERVVHVGSLEEYEAAAAAAGDRLVALEVYAPGVCRTGLSDDEYYQAPELQWKADAKALAAATAAQCERMRHTFLRTARDCPDITFLALEVDDGDAASPSARAADALGVEVLPTLQFRRRGRLLYEHRGVAALDADLTAGVTSLGGALAGGERASDYVAELRGAPDLDAFLAAAPARAIAVVDVSDGASQACMHLFPAVLALARSFQGYAAFGRVLRDAGEPQRALAAALGVREAPTFVFYRGGEEVGRHVGSSRSDLIGKILELQSAAGIVPPPPPRAAERAVPRRR